MIIVNTIATKHHCQTLAILTTVNTIATRYIPLYMITVNTIATRHHYMITVNTIATRHHYMITVNTIYRYKTSIYVTTVLLAITYKISLRDHVNIIALHDHCQQYTYSYKTPCMHYINTIATCMELLLKFTKLVT